jgi:amino acid adenylation domain-containing protein
MTSTLPFDTHQDLLLHRKYWLEALGGSLPETTFPADGRRVTGDVRASIVFDLSPELCARLLKLTRGRPLSVYLFLLSGMAALLHKYTGQGDLVVGSPACLPVGPGGHAWNLVPLRLRVDAEASFETHLRAVAGTALEAYGHQAMPFDELVRLLAVPRREDRWPLLDVLVFLEGVHDRAYAETITCDLAFGFHIADARIAGRVSFRPALHREATVRRIVSHLSRLLERAAADPQLCVGAIDMATPDEGRLFAESAAVFRSLPQDRLVHELFEEEARRSPDRTAIVAGDGSATYGELNVRANRLAHALRRQGVGPEVLVAVHAGRGVDFLASILGVFKAGGAYLPLDRASPPRRLAQVLAQSRSRLVLLGEGLDLAPVLDALPTDLRPRVLPLLGLAEPSDAATDPPRLNAAASLAYVIYTSGSTGLPKGAMLEQQGMLNHLHTKIWDLGLGPDDVVAQNSAPCFDVSVWQFLSVLLVGGRTEVLSDEVNRDPVALLAETERRRITVLEIVPSQLRAMLDEVEARGNVGRELARLRWLVLNGEVLPPELCRAWLGRFPHAKLINAYGPTECSDDVTHQKILVPPEAGCLRVSIGRSLPNTRLYVLDPAVRPVSVGVAGELFVGGIGVGRGYFGDPARTAESFWPDPFSANPGARLYQTGDRVRYLDDGRLDFLGRVDHQIKLRGNRIEPGEIEVVLRSHPAVRDVVVVVRADATGQDRLVAYLVADPAPSGTELRGFVHERLQEYMVPAAFVTLDALPLLANGKIDRRSLPEPGPQAFAASSVQAVPRTPVEEGLARIWVETLGVEGVGIHDSFFDLGGHSLLAMHLVARVREAFGIDLPLIRLFDNPTVAELAIVVTELQAEQADPEELARLIAEARGE